MLRLALCTLAVLWLTPVHAIDAPKGAVILTLSGDIDTSNTGDSAAFDRDMLVALDWRVVETYSDFTKGKTRFSGPTLVSLLDALGVHDGTLHATALDDYKIRIPVSDAAAFDVILALDRDGRAMRVRDKGPVWIIYPAARPEDVNELHSSRMIWQLTHIRVER